jgi:hypothetical protein
MPPSQSTAPLKSRFWALLTSAMTSPPSSQAAQTQPPSLVCQRVAVLQVARADWARTHLFAAVAAQPAAEALGNLGAGIAGAGFQLVELGTPHDGRAHGGTNPGDEGVSLPVSLPVGDCP